MVKLKNEQIGIIAIMIVLSIFVVLTSTGTIKAISVGGDVINPSKIQYMSSDSFFNEPVWSFEYFITGSSGYAEGITTVSDVKDFVEGKTISENFKVIANLENQTCVYTIIDPEIDIYDFKNLDSYQNSVPQGYVSISSFVCAGDRYCFWATNKTKVGEVYYLDSAAIYDSRINFSIIKGNKIDSAYLSPSVLSAQVGDVARVKMLGGLIGTQSCPTPAANTVLFRPINSNELVALNKNEFNSYYSLTASLGSNYETYQQVQEQVKKFVSTPAEGSNICTSLPNEAGATVYSCSPVAPVSIPNLLVNIKASYLGVVVPSGQPEIISIEELSTGAGEMTNLNVDVKNIGTETDSFDVKVISETPITFRATRRSIAAGTNVNIPVEIEGMGVIEKVNVTACSFNSPNKCDSKETLITIRPFCDKMAPAGKILIYTSKGCQPVCANAYQTDIDDENCTVVTTYVRPATKTKVKDAYGNEYIQITYKHFEGNHCTGIGTYTTMDNYMDAVATKLITPFVPSTKENFYWLGYPTCNYVPAYGYDNNGTKLTGETPIIFDQYDINYVEGKAVAYEVNLPTREEIAAPLTDNRTDVPIPQNPYAPSISTGEETDFVKILQNNSVAIFVIIIGLAIGTGIYLKNKKK